MSEGLRIRRLLAFVATGLCCLTAVSAAAGKTNVSGGSTATFNWQMQAVAPATNPNGQATAVFAQLLDSLSNGQIKLTVHFSASLGLSPAQMVDLTSRRAVDIGELIGQFVESAFPEANLPSVPGLIPFNIATRQRVALALAPSYTKLLAPKNIVYLGYCQAGPRSIVSRVPIRTVSDLQGIKLSANGGAAEAALTRAMGANPVTNLATAEIYSALQTGVVDAAWSPDTFVSTAKFYEVAKNLYNAAIGGSTVMWSVNGDDWKALTPALRTVVRKAAAQAFTQCWQLNQNAQDTAVGDLKGHGMTVVEPSAADRKSLARLTAPLAGAWAATHGPNAAQLLHIVEASLGAKTVTATLSPRGQVPRPRGASAAHASVTGVLTPTATGGTLQWSFTAGGLTGPVTRVELRSGPGKNDRLILVLCQGICRVGVSRSNAIPKSGYQIVYAGKPAYFVIATKRNDTGEVRGAISVARLTK